MYNIKLLKKRLVCVPPHPLTYPGSDPLEGAIWEGQGSSGPGRGVNAAGSGESQAGTGPHLIWLLLLVMGMTGV